MAGRLCICRRVQPYRLHCEEDPTPSASRERCVGKWRKQLGALRLVALGLPRQIASTQYDDWPRGRVVYEKPGRRFVIYADRRLQKPQSSTR
jgi:hypothetical protein